MPSNIKKIGVIGAGQMGNGIAHVFALAEYEVYLCDSDADNLDKGLNAIKVNMDRLVSRDLISQDQVDAALPRITGCTDFSSFGDTDLVIEAATEKEDVKKAILQELCKHIGEQTILASNTSSISITRLGSYTDRPERFLGMHFMNPVPRMELVELIRGIATGEEAFKQIRELTKILGKTPVNAEDFPAFIVNRILLPMINEAVYTLYEGVGSVGAIDTAMKLGTNHPMGPLELADFIGLDVCLAVMQVLHDGLADTKYRPCPLLTKYV
ncbi:MAG: 3-hydroxybutyryl-CoA dehydrogenase, partial [Rhodospirillales bacterium]|nr:3-hydroxybutyryl-CoA dehydrogenase [Rhodospirillales bacterium]